jgi:hypothetical protein
MGVTLKSLETGIPAARGEGEWSAPQVMRVLMIVPPSPW